MSKKQFNFGLAAALIMLGVALRLLPHPANFAPVTAVAIFGGAVLPRKLALLVPVIIMMVSDAFIGFYDMMPITWACYVAIALTSNLLLREFRVFRMVTITLASSLFFFVVTNFAVWVSSGMYAHTGVGFVKCYTLALPFFRNTLLSDGIYTAVLIGMSMVVRMVAQRHLKLTFQEL